MRLLFMMASLHHNNFNISNSIPLYGPGFYFILIINFCRNIRASKYHDFILNHYPYLVEENRLHLKFQRPVFLCQKESLQCIRFWLGRDQRLSLFHPHIFLEGQKSRHIFVSIAIKFGLCTHLRTIQVKGF